MNPHLRGWRGERVCSAVELPGDKAVGHSGGPSLKGPTPPTRGQKVEQKECCLKMLCVLRRQREVYTVETSGRTVPMILPAVPPPL